MVAQSSTAKNGKSGAILIYFTFSEYYADCFPYCFSKTLIWNLSQSFTSYLAGCIMSVKSPALCYGIRIGFWSFGYIFLLQGSHHDKLIQLYFPSMNRVGNPGSVAINQESYNPFESSSKETAKIPTAKNRPNKNPQTKTKTNKPPKKKQGS